VKTSFKGLLPLLVLLALPAVLQAQFTFTTNNGAITITGYAGSGGAVTIPDTITGLPVTSIGDNAFVYMGSLLTSVTIPNTVVNIGDLAFYSCSSLTNIGIPNRVVALGAMAFANCASLTRVVIPTGVTNIGLGAFDNCTGLTSVTIPDSVISIGSGAFYHCTNLTEGDRDVFACSMREGKVAICGSCRAPKHPQA
jgi:hypothetical protein